MAIQLHDRLLEMQVLSSMMIAESGAIEGITELTQEDFVHADTRIIFNACRQLFENNSHISPMLIRDELNKADLLESIGGLDAIIEIAQAEYTSHRIVSHIKNLKELRYRRYALAFSEKIALVAKSEKDITKVIVTASDVPNFMGKKANKSTKEIMQDAIVRMAERMKNPQSSIPGNETGFSDFDYLTGGIKDGELIILSAEPNVGKSILAHQVSINFALRGKTAVYFNYEMNEQQIGDRTLAIALPFDVNKIKYPKANLTKTDLSFLSKNEAENLLEQNLYIFSQSHKTLGEVISRCKELRARGKKPDLIVIDYMQLMDGDGKSELEKIESICSGLKRIAAEFACPLLTISSLSREGKLRGSGKLDFDADQKWYLERKHDSSDALERAAATLKITKNRDGGKGETKLVFIEKFLRFEQRERVK